MNIWHITSVAGWAADKIIYTNPIYINIRRVFVLLRQFASLTHTYASAHSKYNATTHTHTPVSPFRVNINNGIIAFADCVPATHIYCPGRHLHCEAHISKHVQCENAMKIFLYISSNVWRIVFFLFLRSLYIYGFNIIWHSTRSWPLCWLQAARDRSTTTTLRLRATGQSDFRSRNWIEFRLIYECDVRVCVFLSMCSGLV